MNRAFRKTGQTTDHVVALEHKDREGPDLPSTLYINQRLMLGTWDPRRNHDKYPSKKKENLDILA